MTAEGYLLTDQVTVPPSSQGISISSDGQVFSHEDDNVQTQIGTIRLHVFPNATGLKALDDNYFADTASSGKSSARQPGVQGAGRIMQATSSAPTWRSPAN